MKTYVINLERRPERKAKMQERLAATPSLDVEFFNAIDGQNFPECVINWQHRSYSSYTPAKLACLYSHLRTMELGRDSGEPHFLVLEDDVVLCEDFEARLEYAMKELPEDWAVLYLGAQIFTEAEPVPGTKTLWQNKGSYGLYSYVVNTRHVQLILDLMQHAKRYNDVYHATAVQQHLPCYLIHPNLVYVEDGESDLEGGHRDLSRTKKNYAPRFDPERDSVTRPPQLVLNKRNQQIVEQFNPQLRKTAQQAEEQQPAPGRSSTGQFVRVKTPRTYGNTTI